MALFRVALFPPLGDAGSSKRAGRHLRAPSYAGALLLCVAALTAFRLVALALSRTELFFDEAQYWFWSRDLALGYYSKPPLIAWIIRGATELCGSGEACIRVPSPLFHAATAMLVYGIGRRLYDARVGFWAGLVYLTLPGVSFSSGLISTDVPLLLFVALGLLAVVNLRERVTLAWAVALGVAIGLGLLSKYAMGYFILSLAIYAVVSREGRAMLKSPVFYVAPLIAAALIAPNIIWNAQNKFATLAHTADNAAWRGASFHPDNALDFLFGQLGVVGPVLFGALVWMCVAWIRQPGGLRTLADRERLLLAFSVPVLLLMLGQAFMSRAHANWAAFAYIAATVLVTATMLRARWVQPFRFSLGLHAVVIVVLAVGGTFAGRFTLPGGLDPYSRVLGWKDIATAAAEQARAGGFQAIATDKRALAAELAYYLRDTNIPIVALRGAKDRPNDHFELTRPLTNDTPRPILLVSAKKQGRLGSESSEPMASAGRSKRSTVYFFAIRGSVD